MTGIAVITDTSALEARLDRIADVAERDSIPQVFGTLRGLILDKTGRGVDAFDKTFNAYRPATIRQREKGNFQTDIKDLKRSKARLYDIVLENDTLTVANSSETITSKSGKSRSVDARTIARGQMSGAGGRWPYKHRFLDVSKTSLVTAGKELTSFLSGRLNG